MHKARLAAAAAAANAGTGMSSVGAGPLKALHPSDFSPSLPTSPLSQQNSPKTPRRGMLWSDHFSLILQFK